MRAHTSVHFTGMALADTDIRVTTSDGGLGGPPRYHVQVKGWDTDVTLSSDAAGLRSFLASIEAEITRAEQREARAVA